MPTGFIPSQDSGFFFGVALAGQDISFESMAKHLRAVADIVQQDPNVEDIGAFVMGGNQAGFFATLKPRAERAAFRRSDHRASCGPSCSAVPGIMAFLQNPPPITVSGQIQHQRVPADPAERQSEGDLRLGRSG